jgi:hypothetical protein
MVGLQGAAVDSLHQQWPAHLLALSGFWRAGGASWFLGSCEWTFGTLLFLGFWNKRLGILGALGSCATFIGTVTIIPFMPEGWEADRGGQLCRASSPQSVGRWRGLNLSNGCLRRPIAISGSQSINGGKLHANASS